MTPQQTQAALRTAEDELQESRGLRARLASWINDPAYDITARRALAQHIGFPAPRTENPAHGQQHRNSVDGADVESDNRM